MINSVEINKKYMKLLNSIIMYYIKYNIPASLYRKASSTMAGFYLEIVMQDYTKPPLTYTEQATLLQSAGS